MTTLCVQNALGRRVSVDRGWWREKREQLAARGWREAAESTLELGRDGSTEDEAAPETARAAADATPPASPLRKPTLVHVLPWPLTVGGAQRMIHDWCVEAGRWWEMHVAAPGAAAAFEFTNAAVHQVAAADADDFVRALAPEVVVHHGAQFNYGRVTPSSGALFWVVHGEYVLSAPRPAWAQPRAIFANYRPRSCHASWPPLAVAPLGVDLRCFRPKAHAEARTLTLGIVGRLSPEKIPTSFARALKRWRPGPWRVRFVGGGDAAEWGERLKTEFRDVPYVEFAGEIPPAGMADEYQRLDALLVPSATETGSYAIVEAMASGLPVVAREVGGVAFTAGGAAMLGRADAELLRAVRRLDEAATRDQWGRLARATAEERNSVAAQAGGRHAACAAALEPAVSVVVPVRDTPPEFLAEMWASVAAQSLTLWELILVDDGSRNPATVAQLDRLAGDPRVRLIRLPEGQGISYALNRGFEAARSELIARMDADDVMLPSRLARQADYLWRHPGVDALGAQLVRWDGARTFEPTDHPAVVTRRVARESWWFLNHPTVMMRRSAWRRAGGYDESLPRAEDLDLWLKMVAAGMTIHNLPDTLLRYRIHPAQVTKGGDVGPIVRRIRARYRS